MRSEEGGGAELAGVDEMVFLSESEQVRVGVAGLQGWSPSSFDLHQPSTSNPRDILNPSRSFDPWKLANLTTALQMRVAEAVAKTSRSPWFIALTR